jgi:hypothetical protein
MSGPVTRGVPLGHWTTDPAEWGMAFSLCGIVVLVQPCGHLCTIGPPDVQPQLRWQDELPISGRCCSCTGATVPGCGPCRARRAGKEVA